VDLPQMPPPESVTRPVYLRDELTPATPGHSIVIDPDELKPFRPSYRLLSYVLSQQDYTVDRISPAKIARNPFAP